MAQPRLISQLIIYLQKSTEIGTFLKSTEIGTFFKIENSANFFELF